MNLAQNKFLVGFGVVMLISCGGLGYYVTEQKSRYDTASANYQKISTDYIALQNAPLFPDAANLEKLKARQVDVETAAKELENNLQPLTIPLEEVAPDHFQDILRKSVDAIVSKAKEKGVTLPDKFYLGFDQYQAQPPKSEAAAPLLRQLRAIELAVHILLDQSIAGVQNLTRDPLPQEGEVKPVAPVPAGKAAPAAKPQDALYTRFPFQIEFSANQKSFKDALNAISGNPKQFFIVRTLVVKNEKPAPLAKDAPTVMPALPVNGAQKHANALFEQNPQPTAPSLQYVLGAEKIDVKLTLEMVVFAGPSTK